MGRKPESPEVGKSEIPEVVANPHLNPVLEGKYRVVNTHVPMVLNSSIGDVYLPTLTEEQAGQLIADGFQDGFVFLEKI